MMRDVGARFKYTEREGDAPPPVASSSSSVNSSSNSSSSGVSSSRSDSEGDASPSRTTPAPPASSDDACPSRELIQQRLRSYHRDVESGAATWRTVSARMQRDLAPYAVLKLGGFSLGDVAPKLLGHVLAAGDSRLRTLDLGFNRIGDRGAALLARALESNAALERLYLSGNDIGPGGAQALARALAANSTLRSLHLSGNNVGEDGAAHLADGLRANRGLRALYVGTNGIGSSGMARLADALTVNRSLRELTLGQNRIGSDGLRHVADAIASGRTLLTTLEVGKNGIDHLGALALARALCGAPNALQNLYMDNNPLGDAGASAFGALLAKSAGLRVLDLSYSHMSLLGLRDLSMGLAHSASLLCLLLDGHDWASTQYMKKTNGLTGASLSAKGAGNYAASCIVGAINSNPRSALLKLTGVDLGLVVAPPPTAASSPVRSDASDAAAPPLAAGAAAAAAEDDAGSSAHAGAGTRRYSDALSHNERVLQFLNATRRPAASNKRKIDDDDGDSNGDSARSAGVAVAAAAPEEPTHPKYQRLDARGPVKSSSSSGSIGSNSGGDGGGAPLPSPPAPTYTARRPPRVGLASRGSLAQFPSATAAAEPRLALKSPRYESTMEAQVRKVIAEIAALPFDADELADLQVFYLGRCHGANEETAKAAPRGRSCSVDGDGGDAAAASAERALCPACRTSRLAKFRRVMALKGRLEASEGQLLVLLRQLHYLVGVFQHVEDAERQIDELLAAAHDPSLLAPPRHPGPPPPAAFAPLRN